jgi:hypothetical protein
MGWVWFVPSAGAQMESCCGRRRLRKHAPSGLSAHAEQLVQDLGTVGVVLDGFVVSTKYLPCRFRCADCHIDAHGPFFFVSGAYVRSTNCSI